MRLRGPLQENEESKQMLPWEVHHAQNRLSNVEELATKHVDADGESTMLE